MIQAFDAEMFHRPVMVDEACSYLLTRKDGIYLDATVGDGGHARAILEKTEGQAYVLGIDRDPEALERAWKRLHNFSGRFKLLHGVFSCLSELLHEAGVREVNGVLFDLGVSSAQLDLKNRGFSFRQEGPLDMRMNPLDTLTAFDIVNSFSEDELADVFFYLGEERYSRRIARAVCRARERTLVQTTTELSDIICRAIPGKRGKIHPATRIFQALRIRVNRELEEMDSGLREGKNVLLEEGVMVVISYHSLEDRRVKIFFRAEPDFDTLTKKPLVPSSRERKENPRSRSGKLRAARKKTRKEGEVQCHG